MEVLCHARSGYEGSLVRVEVDIRRGIPGIDIVGLPGGAVREARERVRAAIRNSGYEFPQDRILINLSPADLPKEGAAFDLAIALGILAGAGEDGLPCGRVLAVGELLLSGELRPVRGVLPAVERAARDGVGTFVVHCDNLQEARALGMGKALAGRSLRDCVEALAGRMRNAPESSREEAHREESVADEGDFAELRGQPLLARAMVIAAAGRHHLLVAGPPGTGKTMAARRLPGILPDLDRRSSLEATRLHSLAGLLGPDEGLLRRPPFRAPHHSASAAGIVGGGRPLAPGEASLAHAGVLFLDEAGEFRANALQALREPMEEGRLRISRAGASAWFPADFQLVVATNPCPCGNLGRPGRECVCSLEAVDRYRAKLGGPLLDRIDLRVDTSRGGGAEPAISSAEARSRVAEARQRQAKRFGGSGTATNGRMGPALAARHCRLGEGLARALEEKARSLGLSARSTHSALKVARTIADLDGMEMIGEAQLFEAIAYRVEWEGTVWS